MIGTDPRNGEQVTRTPIRHEPFAALAFKIAADPFVGKLAFFRVYSGHAQDRLVRLQRDQGREGADRPADRAARQPPRGDRSVSAGDIAAAVGLKNTITGDTLCDEIKPIMLEAINFPEPVIELAVEPKTKADQDKMAIALQRLARRTRPSASAATGDGPDAHRWHGRASPRSDR